MLGNPAAQAAALSHAVADVLCRVTAQPNGRDQRPDLLMSVCPVTGAEGTEAVVAGRRLLSL